MKRSSVLRHLSVRCPRKIGTGLSNLSLYDAWREDGESVQHLQLLFAPPILFKALCGKVSEGVILYPVADLDGIATHFTVFDIGVMTDREVEDH